ncbi:unnamed protein product [Aureobasidium vineae]|uniref:Uncharacterized protein n=1 Tax=Aureobasidium vineae TaxID=2773715 RepID=A0A9N8K1E3_9PEZI|nr:unnamed protein product [Aureobasidium vineae]
MSFTTMSFGALISVGLHSGEVQTSIFHRDLVLTLGQKFRMYSTPMSAMTARYSVTLPYTPHQAPELDEGSTVSGFELEAPGPHGQSPSSPTQNTPSSSGASQCSNFNDGQLSSTETQRYLKAMESRIEQLMAENEILAGGLRTTEKKRMQKKQRKRQEKKVKMQTDTFREPLRATTAVLTPMPKRSPARFVLMAVEAFFLRERVVVS